MLLRKSYDSEILDDFTINDERIDNVLFELKKINKFLGGKRVSSTGINKLLENKITSHVKILDVGSGGSDVLENLNSQMNDINIFSTDLNYRTCYYLKNKALIPYSVCSNAKFLPFKSRSFDIIHISLFLHHFTGDQIVQLLRTFYKEVKIGIIINDLRRNILAYLGIKLVALFFIKSKIVKNDGPLSVRRGFTKEEIEEFLRKSSISYYNIKRMWAFRWLIIIRKTKNEL